MQAVVGAQLDALRDGDTARCFAFASPSNKRVTGPAERFEHLIRASPSYAPMYRCAGWSSKGRRPTLSLSLSISLSISLSLSPSLSRENRARGLLRATGAKIYTFGCMFERAPRHGDKSSSRAAACPPPDRREFIGALPLAADKYTVRVRVFPTIVSGTSVPATVDFTFTLSRQSDDATDAALADCWLTDSVMPDAAPISMPPLPP